MFCQAESFSNQATILEKMCLTFGKNLYLTKKERTTIVFEKKGD